MMKRCPARSCLRLQPSVRLHTARSVKRYRRPCVFRRKATEISPNVPIPSTNSTPKEERLDLTELTAVCPLDGRYGKKTSALRHIFSEFGLIRFRVFVECAWLQHLTEQTAITELSPFRPSATRILESLKQDFSIADAQKVKQYESVTNHDVKAVEYFLKDAFRTNPDLSHALEFVHFACTSEDINNLAYSLMIKQALQTNIIPWMDRLIHAISNLAETYADAPMLARTHGQPASPTTMGKEMANFAYHLNQHRDKLSDVRICGKMAGAVGNYNAHLIAYPAIDWPSVSEAFVTKLGLDWNPYVTQIEPHYCLAELFHAVERFNTALLDFDRDVWGYISLNYFKQKTVRGEVGSSTMPHKVNPIDFENSEGNLGVANALLLHFASKLPVSRFQRDLSDSTVLRNIGVAFGHSLLAYQSTCRGIEKLILDENRLKRDLENCYETLSEAVQTVMRRYGIPEPYEKLKEMTRGKAIEKGDIHKFVQNLDIPQEAKDALLTLSPQKYTGNAAKQAKNVKNFLPDDSKEHHVARKE